ncbi:hypothetical protein CRG98_000138 [Punica granatum]|uniref:Uncharacterized protein n=1 Tax=Punica granatum TaxID=22663 RepID=A0A2I0LFP0_PUNGR|nr:hypothetical protein CRG98_000138 [Punica granatum]
MEITEEVRAMIEGDEAVEQRLREGIGSEEPVEEGNGENQCKQSAEERQVEDGIQREELAEEVEMNNSPLVIRINRQWASKPWESM